MAGKIMAFVEAAGPGEEGLKCTLFLYSMLIVKWKLRGYSL
jgi:hypothetical protein